MAPPYSPSDWKNLIPTASSSLCSKLLALPGRLAIYIYNTMKWAQNEDGSASDDFRSWVGIATAAAGSPSGVAATDGSFEDKVVVTWTAVSGAISYSIWRSNTTNSADSAQVGSSTTTSWDDTSVVVGTTYTYFVKSVTTGGSSGFSLGDAGFAQVGSGPGSQSFSTGTHSFTVPAGVTSIDIEGFGAGGNGGSRGTAPFSPPGSYSGGGGGGGGQTNLGSLTVTPGHVYTIIITSSGTAFNDGATNLLSCVAGQAGASGALLGTGGLGGSGGTVDGSLTATSGSVGDNGSDYPGGTSGGAGGASNPVEVGSATGGNGSSTTADDQTSGLPGKVNITWA